MSDSTPRVSRRGALWLCYGGMMCLAVAGNLLPVYLTTFSETFGGVKGLTDEQLGRIPSVAFIGLVAGILASGPLADRWGAKSFAIIGLALTSIGLALLAVAERYETLLMSAAVMGFGAGVIDMVMSPIVSALEPERRASALNWLHSFYCTGAVGTTLVASAALALGVSWRTVTLAMIALPAGLLLGFVPTRIPPLLHEDATRDPVPVLLRQPLFIGVLIAILLAGATEVGLAQWLPAYTERQLGYSKAAGAMALAGFSIGMVMGRMLAGVAGHRVKPISLIAASCSVTAALFLVGSFSPYGPLALAACVTIGFTNSCVWPTLLSVAADRFPHGGASMFGMLAAAGNIGCFIMPWLVGVVSEKTGLVYGLASITACPVLLFAIVIRMRRH